MKAKLSRKELEDLFSEVLLRKRLPRQSITVYFRRNSLETIALLRTVETMFLALSTKTEKIGRRAMKKDLQPGKDLQKKK